MIDFSPVSDQIINSDLINAALHSLKEAEAEALFTVAVHKDKIYRAKKEYFSQNSIDKIFICRNETNLGHVNKKIGAHDITFIDPSFFSSENDLSTIKSCMKNSLVIMTNNIFAEIGAKRFSLIFKETPETIYAVHDYDNHHWLSNSAQITLFADLYIPAHQSDHLINSRLNPNILGGVPCGSNQWSNEFISTNKALIFSIKRMDDPLGKYFYYEKFSHRNKTIGALGAVYGSISTINHNFHSLTESQKWQEWSGHKLHWIIPVLNDLPIRFFDALITGGIPLVPRALVPQLHALNIPSEFYLTFGPMDILEPANLVSKGLSIFNELGDDGILQRHEYCLEHFHVDAICKKIIEATDKLYK